MPHSGMWTFPWGWEPLELVRGGETRQAGLEVGVEEARKTICKPKGQAFARDAAGGSAWWGVSTGQAAEGWL